MRKTAILDLIIIFISKKRVVLFGRRYLLAVAKIACFFINFVELNWMSAYNWLLVYKIVFGTLMLMIWVCEMDHILLLNYLEILVLRWFWLLLYSRRSLVLRTFEHSS